MHRRALTAALAASFMGISGCSDGPVKTVPASTASASRPTGAEHDWQLLDEDTRKEYCRAYMNGTISSVEDLGFSNGDAGEHFFEDYVALLKANC